MPSSGRCHATADQAELGPAWLGPFVASPVLAAPFLPHDSDEGRGRGGAGEGHAEEVETQEAAQTVWGSGTGAPRGGPVRSGPVLEVGWMGALEVCSLRPGSGPARRLVGLQVRWPPDQEWEGNI